MLGSVVGVQCASLLCVAGLVLILVRRVPNFSPEFHSFLTRTFVVVLVDDLRTHITAITDDRLGDPHVKLVSDVPATDRVR